MSTWSRLRRCRVDRRVLKAPAMQGQAIALLSVDHVTATSPARLDFDEASMVLKESGTYL